MEKQNNKILISLDKEAIEAVKLLKERCINMSAFVRKALKEEAAKIK